MVWRVVLTTLLASAARGDRLARLVLIVGNNRPADASQPPLRYADDDAIRYYERFEGLAEHRIVLTRLDDESALYRRVYPDVVAPTRAAVARAATELRARAAELRRSGTFVELIFVFAGHGGLDWDKPYLALEDGRLGAPDLEKMLLQGDPADLTHVIIDACSAASWVEGRGPLRGNRKPLPRELLPFRGLAERYGRAGFLLAASSGGSAYEWSRFGSGVASHLIRSALSGAADVSPPDGMVTYDEMEAFLRQATADVLPEGYRQEFRVMPPRDLASAALVDLRADLAELLVDRPGRYYLRDADGHRIADLHHGRGTARLVLPPYSPRFALVGVTQSGAGCDGPGRFRECVREEAAHEFEAGGKTIRMSALAAERPAVAARGLIEDSVFEQLFARPFDAGAVRHDEPPPAPTLRAPVSLGAGYRALIGRMQQELLATHAVDLRLEFPIGARGFVAPVAGVGRGTAKPEQAPAYPVYQYDIGLEGGLVLIRGPFRLLGGFEARYQVLDQSLPDQQDQIGSLALGGPVLRADVALSSRIGFGFAATGGARVGTVDGDTRTRPYITFSGSVVVEL